MWDNVDSKHYQGNMLDVEMMFRRNKMVTKNG